MLRHGSLTMTTDAARRSRIAPALCLLLLAGLPAFAGQRARADNAKPSPEVWLTEDGDARVRIGPCGKEICGVVVWQRVPYNDEKNPDPAKRSRPIVGIRMISHIQPTGPDSWSGELYVFDEGFTVKGTAKHEGRDKLKLSGCVLGGIVCHTVIWTRVK